MNPEGNPGLVGVRQIEFDRYPSVPPFDPSQRYAEYDFACYAEANAVYDAVRNVLRDLQLDRENMASEKWSPFRDLVKPGDKVVIKPNLVLDADNQEAVTTHASVIRPIVDYVWKALNGIGSIVICDAPVEYADFDRVAKRSGLQEMVQALNGRGYAIGLIDLRARKTITKNNVAIREFDDHEKSENAVGVDLRDTSFFAEENVKQDRLAYGDYGSDQTRKNHHPGCHRYRIARLILEADAVICVPKLKTHKKAGITCCLKNIVGINVDKDCLPHYTSGPANCGGDEFPALPVWRIPILYAYKAARSLLLGHLRRYTAKGISAAAGLLSKFRFKIDAQSPVGKADTAQRVYQLVTGTDYGGSWSGNETIWRMILDLNRIFRFADADGNIRAEKNRKVFYLVDGFISGVKDGPLTPHVMKPGIVAAGFNAALVDQAIIELAGIDAGKIPLYREAFSPKADWLHENLAMQIKLDGKQLERSGITPITRLQEPRHWDYTRN